jgi:nicotinic acid phosphoribosyltransferase
MIVNFAERAHNHNWELDPVIRSLLDTDFYKLLMLQFIWKRYPKIRVSFSLFNRTSSVRLAEVFATKEIVEQLEHVRTLRFQKSELVWLAGNTMVLAALANDDQALKASQYHVLDLWQRTYDGAGAPDWTADWTGQRMDSKNPYVAGDEYIEWLKGRGRDPQDKLVIASDALDIDEIIGLHAYFGGKLQGGTTAQEFRSAADFQDRQKLDSRPAHPVQRGLGNFADQRFPRL